MYEKFYGFREKPFSLLPDPGFLYLSENHSIAFSRLEYSLLNEAGFVVISGEVGSGKTTLIRHFLNNTSDQISVGLISNSSANMGNLLPWILHAFDQPYTDNHPVVLHDLFSNFLIDQYSNRKKTLLIIDEAQNLSEHSLEELRMLSNINADKDQLLQIILVGQPELRDKIKKPELLQFAQRISTDYHINPLKPIETAAYILHRTRTAGRVDPLFDIDAVRIIHKSTNGVPRLINSTCDLVLNYGYADSCILITGDFVRGVLEERDKLSSIN